MRIVTLILLIVSTALAEPKYPPTNKVEFSETLHGQSIADPYRWLEDDNSEQTKAWVEAQNTVTFGYLNAIPQKPAIKARLTEVWNYERIGMPSKRGGRYFFTRNDGLQNQSVLYTAKSLADEPRVLLDPNTLSKDGTIAVSGTAVSEDGSLLAYSLSTAGSDWQEIRLREVEGAKDRPDHLKWVKFSGISWSKDGAGFFYSRYDEPAENEKLTKTNFFQKLYYHRIGTPQGEDVLVYHRPDKKDWGIRGGVSDDGRYLIIVSSQGTDPKNRVMYKDLVKADSPVVELLMDFDAEYDFLVNIGTTFYFKTDLKAPRGRVIAIDIDKPARESWREIIPESKDTLTRVSAVGGRFFARYLQDAKTAVRIFAVDGKPMGDVALPGIGSANGFGGRWDDDETFYSFTSYTNPGSIYRIDLSSNQTALFRRSNVKFESDKYETTQVFYTSKDGTRVPMFITHRKGMSLDGNNPTILYGYGGFGASMTPGFSASNAVWLEMGGVYAVANLRGGGEYGEDWHQAGMKLRKQNVFDDFIAAAEYLIREKYTSSKKLAISGGSNGGLLVGAAMVQRPELFGAALPAVGVMDMLRFHKFTIGWAWTSDYGSPDDAKEFAALVAYSPYHNLKPGVKYPATLVTTSDHDDRVVPAHSFKFAARLQEYHAGAAPVLIRIEKRAGHGAGKPTNKIIESQADVFAFLVKNLEMSPPQK